MSIFINSETRIVVQGVTGSEGLKHTIRMQAAGSNIVAGTNPRKAGEVVADGVPVLASVREAVESFGADASIVFVPPAFAKGAVVEAVDAGIKLIVVITEGVPLLDSAYFVAYARERGVRLIGPNCPGLVTLPSSDNPGCNLGIIPDGISGAGPIGLVSKSGTLTYQLLASLSDVGFTSAVGIGGDPAIGTSHIDCLEAFEQDADTKIIVMVGEIGGSAEEEAAVYIADNVRKPVVAYIAGFEAPEGKTMGHAGAIISQGKGDAASKAAALEAAGVKVGRTPEETAALVRELLVQI